MSHHECHRLSEHSNDPLILDVQLTPTLTGSASGKPKHRLLFPKDCDRSLSASGPVHLGVAPVCNAELLDDLFRFPLSYAFRHIPSRSNRAGRHMQGHMEDPSPAFKKPRGRHTTCPYSLIPPVLDQIEHLTA